MTLLQLVNQPDYNTFSDAVTATLCGDYLELLISPERTHSGEGQPPKNAATNTQRESDEDRLKRSISRSQKTVRHLCNTNRLYILYTLTYAVKHPSYFPGEKPFALRDLNHQKDREKVLEDWRQFARKIRAYEASKDRHFCYVTIIEKHTGKRAKDTTIKADTYHIHFLTDRIHNKRMIQAKWGHGLVNYSDWRVGTKSRDMADDYDGKPPTNPGVYASKYLGKDMRGEYSGRKRYWASSNLLKPIKTHGVDALKAAGAGAKIYESVTNKEILDMLTFEHKTIRTVRCTYKIDAKLRNNRKTRSKREVRKEKALNRLQIERFRSINNARKQEELLNAKLMPRNEDDASVERIIAKKQYIDAEAVKIGQNPKIHRS
jgi:hypothetical protein